MEIDKKMRELCFKLIINDKVNYDESQIIDNFISFALDNDASFGGDIKDGCFVSKESFSSKNMKKRFIKFLKANYPILFKEISFQSYNEQEDSFEELERINLTR